MASLSDAPWLDAVLAPQTLAPVPSAQAAPLGDLEVVALLVSGRLHDVDDCLRTMGYSTGLQAMDGRDVDQDLPIAGPVGRWLFRFGRETDAPDDLVALAGTMGGEPAAAVALVSAVALATDQRLDAAVEVLEGRLATAVGDARNALLLQLSCRLLERGDRMAALEAVEGSLAIEEGTVRSRELCNVARYNRLNASLLEDRDANEVMDLEMAPIDSGSAYGIRQETTGLRALTTDVATLLVSAPPSPRSRSFAWDQGWEHLLGAWLRAELWGDWASMRSRRRLLGLYPITESLLSAPAGWMRTTADAVDLDLVRRSGDDRLTGDVVRVWWETGAVEDLVTAVHRAVEGPWTQWTELPNLAMLAAAGDVVAPETADELITQLVNIFEDDHERSFIPAYYVAPAMVEILHAATEEGHEHAARAVIAHPSDPAISRPLAAVVRALDLTKLTSITLAHLLSLASTATTDEAWEIRSFGIDVALQLSHHSRSSDALAVLSMAWERRPSLAAAAGLIASEGSVSPPRQDLVQWLLARLDHDDHSEGWLDARVLLAALATDEVAAAHLRRWLVSDPERIRSRHRVLVQLAAQPFAAAAVIDKATAAAIQDALDRDLDEAFLGPSDLLMGDAMRACARAGQLQQVVATNWLVKMVGGTSHERWVAARTLDAFRSVMDGDTWRLLSLVLLADREISVAAEATAGVGQAISESSTEKADQLVAGIVAVARRAGCLGPVVGAHALGRASRLEDDLIQQLVDHPSARVRAAVDSRARP